MKILIAITITCLVLSLLKDRGMTLAGIRNGMALVANLLPAVIKGEQPYRNIFIGE